MSWTNRDETWWQDEFLKHRNLSDTQAEMVAYLSGLTWTHLYHQTFRRQVSDGQSALALGSRFLAEYASSSGVTAALLVAERHPFRQSKKRRSACHRTEYVGKRLKIGTDYEGRRGRLYHLHGLLATSPARWRERRTNRTSSRGFTLRSRTLPPSWMQLKEAAYSTLGISRIWKITTTREVAATVYALKYILKGMKHWPENQRTDWTPRPEEPKPTHDDWQLLRF